ncbi:MAG: NAD(P)/FAD-dependent oxidoreductase [Candidatus Omnitrophica bacterium]|nr:NAD(P)/FAD-dependent oxidoreductase [Candidatus Omnitrophota bacterium]
MNEYDITVIGGGIIGTAIARELCRYKLKIALLEKEEELAFGVSKSNSGIIHPGTQNPPHSLKGRLCVQGNILARHQSRELGFDFKEVGELIVAFNEEEVSRLVQLKKEAELLKVPKLAIVGRSWLRKREPNLSKDAVAALYAPTAGIVSPYRWVYDLSENAVKNGAEIHTLTKVENIVLTGQPVSPNKPRFEIHTTKGIFKTRYVINAAGLFADVISKMAGVNSFQIKPRKGEEFLLDKKRQYMTNHLLFPLPSKTSKGILIIKTSDGNPMIGPTAEEIPDKEDLSTSDKGLKKVLDAARKMVPSIDENDIIAYFAGLRPAAGDDFIIRYEDKAPGFINVAGIQSPGLTSAPAIALMVADILKNNGLSMRQKLFFRGHRRKTVHLFALSSRDAKKIIKRDSRYGDIVCRCEMVSAGEVKDAIKRGAKTLDGIKFRTRAQAGRCHGTFCTTRLMRILAEETGRPLTGVTKRGKGSEIVKRDRNDA